MLMKLNKILNVFPTKREELFFEGAVFIFPTGISNSGKYFNTKNYFNFLIDISIWKEFLQEIIETDLLNNICNIFIYIYILILMK